MEKRLKAIAAELAWLRQGELSTLKQQAKDAHAGGRNMLKDLGEKLDRDIGDAREVLKRAMRKGTP